MYVQENRDENEGTDLKNTQEAKWMGFINRLFMEI